MSTFRLSTYQVIGSAAGPAYLNGGVCPITPNAQGVPPAILLKVSTGAVLTYNVEVTGDAIQTPGYVPNNGLWIPFPGFVGLTATQAGSLGALVTGVRLNLPTWTSGTVIMQIVQLVP